MPFDFKPFDANQFIQNGQAGQRVRTLADIGPMIAQGNYGQAAGLALAGGAPEQGMSLLTIGAQDRRAAEARAFQEKELQATQDYRNKALAIQAANAARAGVPPGYMRNADGSMSFIPGGPADPSVLTAQTVAKAGNKPMTSDQANAGVYADRMTEAEPIIEKYQSAGTSLKNQALASAGNLPVVGPLANYGVSEDFQKLDQAQRNFINATLRRESGAAISPSEFENAKKQYFPQPGDSKDVIEQKRKNRETARLGIARAAGPTYRPAAGGGAAPADNDPLGIR
jgi:hypothetical protein